MKIKLFLIFFLLTSPCSYSQSKLITDSLLKEVCASIINSQEKTDSAKIDAVFNLHFSKIFSLLSDSLFEETYSYIYIRLQKLCPEYKILLDKIHPSSGGDYVSLETKPISKLNKKVCSEFLNHKRYYYFEDNGDTIHLIISKGLWIENFKDGTYSKLKFSWVSDCEFEISFLESNNKIRKSLSKLGDKYRYQLTDKHERYYDVCLDMRQISVLGTFRMYYSDNNQ